MWLRNELSSLAEVSLYISRKVDMWTYVGDKTYSSIRACPKQIQIKEKVAGRNMWRDITKSLTVHLIKTSNIANHSDHFHGSPFNHFRTLDAFLWHCALSIRHHLFLFIKPLGRPRRRWVDNIRMDLQEVGCGHLDWIGLVQDRDRRRTLVRY